MENLAQDLRSVEDSHGRNVLNLVVVVGYLKRTPGERPRGPLPVAAQRRHPGRVPEDRRVEIARDRGVTEDLPLTRPQVLPETPPGYSKQPA